jgi:hypothetical protein
MGAFWGLVLLSCVVGFYLRRLWLSHVALIAMLEAVFDRIARRNGDPPIRADVDPDALR